MFPGSRTVVFEAALGKTKEEDGTDALEAEELGPDKGEGQSVFGPTAPT
jgi:hypothetical protein